MICPSCSSECPESQWIDVYGPHSVPILNNTVFPTRDQALVAASGAVDIAACPRCGYAFNLSFNPATICYDENYDASRGNSHYYTSHQAKLVETLATKLSVSSSVLEIGSGDGKFLKSVCAESGCTGMGIDPGVSCSVEKSRVRFNPDMRPLPTTRRYSMLIMQHVLEHIPNPRHFVEEIAATRLIENAEVYIEVPCLDWIIQNNVWFDFTYEHVNYFTKTSLRNLCGIAGLEVASVGTGYGGQYLQVFARYTGRTAALEPPDFDESASRKVQLDSDFLRRANNEEEFAIWGASGKGVIFLCHLPEQILQKVACAVDINPAKQGKFLPLSGIEVVPPEALQRMNYPIMVMNPVYEAEIVGMIKRMGLKPNVQTVH